MLYQKSRILFSALFLFFVSLTASDRMELLKMEAGSAFNEYNEYVKKFGSADQHAEILYRRYLNLSRQYELLQKVMSENESDFNPALLLGFDIRKSSQELKKLSFPSPENDYRLALVNIIFYNYKDALSLIDLSLKKAEFAKREFSDPILAAAYCFFKLALVENENAKKKEAFNKAQNWIFRYVPSDKKTTEAAASLKAKIESGLELCRMVETESGGNP